MDMDFMESVLLSTYCPKWAEGERKEVRLALAHGAYAQDQVETLRRAFGIIRNLDKPDAFSA